MKLLDLPGLLARRLGLGDADPLYARYLEQGMARGCLMVNTYRVEADDLVFAGNIICPFGLPARYVVRVDGRDAAFRHVRPSPSLSARFGAGTVYEYEAVARLGQDRPAGPALVTAHPGGASEPVWEQSWALPLEPVGLPDAARRLRVHGTEETSSYLVQGASAAWKIDHVLRSYAGHGLTGRVLDWGCGCGRVLQQLMPRVGEAELHGCDVDRDNLAWCRENLDAAVGLSAQRPPLPYPDAHFRLVYGISVFSHIPRAVEAAWVAELARVLEPGGFALMSVNGAHCQAWLRPKGMARLLRAGGAIDLGADRALVGNVPRPELYRLVAHTPAHIARIWTPHFELLDVIPGCIGATQDLIVARRRDG